MGLIPASSKNLNRPLLDRLWAFGDLAAKKAPAIIHRFLDNCLCIQVDVSSLNSPHNLQKRILSFETSLKKSDVDWLQALMPRRINASSDYWPQKVLALAIIQAGYLQSTDEACRDET
jgi:hypothetical protein